MVCPSFRPSVPPSILQSVRAFSWNYIIINFGMVLETHMKLCMTAGFSGKNIFWPKNWENGPKMGQNQGFFKFIEKFGHYVLLNLFYNENLYNLLCSCANRIFGKIFVSEIWAKMFSDNQIARLFNQPYLQNRSMK